MGQAHTLFHSPHSSWLPASPRSPLPPHRNSSVTSLSQPTSYILEVGPSTKSRQTVAFPFAHFLPATNGPGPFKRRGSEPTLSCGRWRGRRRGSRGPQLGPSCPCRRSWPRLLDGRAPPPPPRGRRASGPGTAARAKTLCPAPQSGRLLVWLLWLWRVAKMSQTHHRNRSPALPASRPSRGAAARSAGGGWPRPARPACRVVRRRPVAHTRTNSKFHL